MVNTKRKIFQTKIHLFYFFQIRNQMHRIRHLKLSSNKIIILYQKINSFQKMLFIHIECFFYNIFRVQQKNQRKMNQVKMSDLYEKNSSVQSSMLLGTITQIEKQVSDYMRNNPQRFQGNNPLPFTIADLGCANGKNSTPIFTTIINRIKSQYQKISFIIYLIDTPTNDSNLALQTVTQSLKQYDNISIFYQGKSFYQSLFPENYIDIIFTFASVHWYSKKYNHTSQTFYHFITSDSPKNQNSQVMEKIAEQEWNKFLTQRERELKVGGKLFVGTVTTNEQLSEHDKSFIYQYTVVNRCLNQVLQKYSLSHLINNINLPIVVRQKRHYAKYFQTYKQKTKLNMLVYQVFDCRSALWDPSIAKQDIGEYSKKYSMFVKAYASEVIRVKLVNAGVQDSISRNIVQQFFDTELPKAYIKQIDNFTGVIPTNIICIQKKQ